LIYLQHGPIARQAASKQLDVFSFHDRGFQKAESRLLLNGGAEALLLSVTMGMYRSLLM